MPADDHDSDDAPPASRIPPARVRVRTPTAAEPPLAPTDSDYEVGYRRPPRAHQFQPGRSGNPKGRPKGSRSIASILSDELDKPISANVKGRTVTMPRRQALVRRLLEKALGGDLKAVALLIKLDQGAGAADDMATPGNQTLSSAEADLLSGYLAKLEAEDA